MPGDHATTAKCRKRLCDHRGGTAALHAEGEDPSADDHAARGSDHAIRPRHAERAFLATNRTTEAEPERTATCAPCE